MSASVESALVTASVRLAAVLARENAALAALDLGRAAAMLAEKQDAASFFALALERARPLPPDADARGLAALARRLDGAARENRRLLEQGIAVQGRVIATVVRAIPPSFGAPAMRYGGRGTAPAACRTPLTLSLRA